MTIILGGKNQILAALSTIQQQQEKILSELTDLQTAVAQTGTLVSSISADLSALSTRIQSQLDALNAEIATLKNQNPGVDASAVEAQAVALQGSNTTLASVASQMEAAFPAPAPTPTPAPPPAPAG